MHNQFLLAALDQAWLGRGICAPNPAVGAVAVQNGSIIAQASHRGCGTPHAEQLLLAQLPSNMLGITVYVSLEPCNHWGKTPPCVDAIIQYGVAQVVYAYRDPNPVVQANDTSALLRQHGIDVLYMPLPEVDRFYESYRHWTLTHKPWVTAKIAQTFDGKIAGALGARTSLSNELCHHFTHTQRQHTDIILTTARTIATDDPQLNVRLSQEVKAKPVAILDRTLSLDAQATVLSTAARCHIYHDAQYPVRRAHPRCSYHAIPTHLSELDLNAILHHLGSLGYHDVWVEAGGRLFGALHQAKLVNRTHVYLVPLMLGEKGVPVCQQAGIFNQANTLSWLPMGNNMIASLDWEEDVCLQV